MTREMAAAVRSIDDLMAAGQIDVFQGYAIRELIVEGASAMGAMTDWLLYDADDSRN